MHYHALIGDDDSSTIAKIHQEVDADVSKISDIQHVKMNLDGVLLKIKGKHKELTENVCKYVKRSFSYAIAQNEGKDKELAKNMRAIPDHMFGMHENCGCWCGYEKNPQSYKHKFSKGGKDLYSQELHQDLKKIINKYANNSTKLCPRGSSQRNESLNNTIGSKAPKIRHYGGSASNDHRVAAAVLQKNIGYHYVPKVMSELNLSPGRYTKLHALRMNHIIHKNKIKSTTQAHKLQRVIRRSNRTTKLQELEVQEGTTYKTGVAYSNDKIDITQIPKAISRPELKTLGDNALKNSQVLIIDVETSGSGIIK